MTMHVSSEGDDVEGGAPENEELPVYHYILEVFDRSVQAATVMQRAYRLLKVKCKSGVMPSDEDPFHFKHFTRIRRLVGWSKDELFDEYGDRRERTDGGKPRSKKKREGYSRLMDEVRDTELGKLTEDAYEALLKQLEAARGRWSESFASNDALNRLLNARSNVTMVSGYLRERWNKMKEEEANSALLKNPLKEEFKQGSQQWEKLMHWMLSNGHGSPIKMHEPALLDLQASLSVDSESHRPRIMGLLAQFNTILRIKQGQLPRAAGSDTNEGLSAGPDANEGQPEVKVNSLAVGLFDWAIKDTGLEYKEELEESRRYAATPPEPPEGLDSNLYRFHAQVCSALKASSYRTCRLRKSGREFLQAFEDSAQKRRRLIRTRSSGCLGLLGPPTVDPSSVTDIHPMVGKPKGSTAKQWVHTQLQEIVKNQAKRQNRGRSVRPLRCINTEWMGGVDWRMIESRATGCPPPKGLRIPPKPTDQELGDLFEVFTKNKAAMKQDTEEKGTEKDCESVISGQSLDNSSEALPDDPDIPFDSGSLYVQEVHGILEESGLTGLGCKTVLANLMAAARTPVFLPPLDSVRAAAAATSWLQAAHGSQQRHYYATQHARLLHCAHAFMGSATQNQALLEVAKDQGAAVHARSLSDLLPNQVGRAIERALEVTLSEGICHKISPEITWPMMLQCWRAAGLPGWQGQDGRALWKVMDAFSPSHTRESSSADLPSKNLHLRTPNAPPSLSPSPSFSPATPTPASPFSPTEGNTSLHASLSADRGLSKSDFLTPLASKGAGLATSAPMPSVAKPKHKGAPGGGEASTPFEPYSPSVSDNSFSGSLTSPFATSSPSQLSLSFTNGGAKSPSAMMQARAVARERRRQQALEANAANRAKRESWAYDISPKASPLSLQSPKPQAPTSSLKQSLVSKHSASTSAPARPRIGLRSESSHRPQPPAPSWPSSVACVASSGSDDEEEDEKGQEGLDGSGGVGPLNSDMLLLRRGEFWSSVLADAHVIVLFAEHHMPWQPYFHGATVKQRQLRVKVHAETVQKLALYVEHHFKLQRSSKAVRVRPAKITQAGADARKKMQLDWCKLVRSEVYKWLNRYLVLGKLPSNFKYVQEESSFFADSEHPEQEQQLEQQQQEPCLQVHRLTGLHQRAHLSKPEPEPSSFERRLHAIEEAPAETSPTPLTSGNTCQATISGSVAAGGGGCASAHVIPDPEPASLDEPGPSSTAQACASLQPHPPPSTSTSSSSTHAPHPTKASSSTNHSPHPPKTSSTTSSSSTHTPHPPKTSSTTSSTTTHVLHPPKTSSSTSSSITHTPHPPKTSSTTTSSSITHTPHPPKTSSTSSTTTHVPHPPKASSTSTSSSFHGDQPTRSSAPVHIPFVRPLISTHAAALQLSVKNHTPVYPKSSSSTGPSSMSSNIRSQPLPTSAPVSPESINTTGPTISPDHPPATTPHIQPKVSAIGRMPSAPAVAQNPFTKVQQPQASHHQLQAPGPAREAFFSWGPVSPKTGFFKGLRAETPLPSIPAQPSWEDRDRTSNQSLGDLVRFSPTPADRGSRSKCATLNVPLPRRQTVASPLSLSCHERSLAKHDIVFERLERSSFLGSTGSRDSLLQRQSSAINSTSSNRDPFSLRQGPATNALARNKGRFANADAMVERSQGCSPQSFSSPRQQSWQTSRSSDPGELCPGAGSQTPGSSLHSKSNNNDSRSSPLIKFGAAKYSTSRSNNSNGPLLKYGAAGPQEAIASQYTADLGGTSNCSSGSGTPPMHSVGNSRGSDGVDLSGLLEFQGER